ncbi:hypothetical protein D1872_340730 [compost metagenome]
MDEDRPLFAHGESGDCLRLKQRQWRGQLVTAPTNFVNGEVQLTFQMLQLFPNCAATHP